MKLATAFFKQFDTIEDLIIIMLINLFDIGDISLMHRSILLSLWLKTPGQIFPKEIVKIFLNDPLYTAASKLVQFAIVVAT
jgi:hypothetical protein